MTEEQLTCESTTEMVDYQEPSDMVSRHKYTAAEKRTVFQQGEKRRRARLAYGPEQVDFWKGVARKLESRRSEMALGRKYIEMAGIAREIKELLMFEGMQWSEETKQVEGSEAAWRRVKSHPECQGLGKYRFKRVEFLTAEDVRRPGQYAANERVEGRVPDVEVEWRPPRKYGQGGPGEGGRRPVTRAVAQGDSQEEEGDEGEEDDTPDVGGLFQALPDDVPNEVADERASPPPPQQQRQPPASALSLQRQPFVSPPRPSTQDKDRALQKRVREQLKKDEKEGTWLKKAGRVKAAEILRNDQTLADEFVEEEDEEARRIFLKGILRKYDGNLSDLYEVA